MPTKSSKPVSLFACLLLLLSLLACNLIRPAVQPAAPTAAGGNAAAGSNAFNLTLPDGSSVQLQVSCDGIKPGQFLNLNAMNTQDASDPKRIWVQVSGTHASTGQIDNMYLMVAIGAQNAWIFMGNTPSASLTLNADGSGSFSNVAVVNATASSPTYISGSEYKFSGEWKCSP